MTWILVIVLLVAVLALFSRRGPRGLDDTRAASPTDTEADDESPAAIVEVTGDTLDLHGAPPSEIGALVDAFIESSHQRGYRSVRIIHGKGIGAQRRSVRARLAKRPEVIAFADAPPPSGWGATVVQLNVRPQVTP